MNWMKGKCLKDLIKCLEKSKRKKIEWNKQSVDFLIVARFEIILSIQIRANFKLVFHRLLQTGGRMDVGWRELFKQSKWIIMN